MRKVWRRRSWPEGGRGTCTQYGHRQTDTDSRTANTLPAWAGYIWRRGVDRFGFLSSAFLTICDMHTSTLSLIVLSLFLCLLLTFPLTIFSFFFEAAQHSRVVVVVLTKSWFFFFNFLCLLSPPPYFSFPSFMWIRNLMPTSRWSFSTQLRKGTSSV